MPIVHSSQISSEFAKESSTLPVASPFSVFIFRDDFDLGWLLCVIEKRVHRNFKGTGHLLQRFDGRNRVAVLDSRNVAAEQSRPLFDIALRELLLLRSSLAVGRQ